jgi:PAS domain S-box-containing protein
VAHHELTLEVAGRTRHLYATAMPLRSPHGEVDEAMVMVQDVSDLEVLRRSNVRTELLLAQMPAILWTTDTDLRFTSSTGAGLAGLDLAPNDAVGLTLFEYFGTDDPAFLAIAAHRQAMTGRSETFETEWKGRVFHVHVEALLDGSRHGDRTVGVALDVTERKQAEEALRQSEATLRERDEQLRQSQKMEAIGTLAGGVAHDFNNILTGILGYAALLKRGAQPGERVHKAAEVIEKAAERGASLTRQLLGFARRGRTRPSPWTWARACRRWGRSWDGRWRRTSAWCCCPCPRPVRLRRSRPDPAGGPEPGRERARRHARGRHAHPGRRARAVAGWRRLRAPDRAGHRLWDRGGAPAAHLRALLHHQGAGEGDGHGPGHGLRDRAEPRRDRAGDQPAGGGNARAGGPAAHPGAGGAAACQDSRPSQEIRGTGSFLVVDDEEVVRQATSSFLEELGYQVSVAEDGGSAVRGSPRILGAWTWCCSTW